jgi:hypothetical protein
MALGRKTGGRQKGARNRATANARAAAEATGILPLDYMLMVMRDAHAEPKRRDAMAIAAAPYLHSRLSSIEAAKPEQSSLAEKYGIRVVFVRPRPRHEDDEDVAIEHSPRCKAEMALVDTIGRETECAYRHKL